MKIAAILSFITILCLPSHTASAGQWIVCRYEMEVVQVDRRERHLSARLVRSITRLNDECPKPGETLIFTPESTDYQSMLPIKKWPRAGVRSTLTYRHLDGICKNDGNPKPCRIKHYSIP